MTDNFKAFLVLLFLGLVLSYAALAAPPAADDVPQILMVVAYKDGLPVAAQAIGFAPNLQGCQAGLEAELAGIETKPGITYAALCTPTPPAPPK